MKKLHAKFFISIPLFLLFFTLLLLPGVFAYIDPGTGGYLISAIWTWIVTGVAFVSAFFIYFFKYKVMGFLRWIWKKFKLWIIIVGSLLLLLCVVLVVMYYYPKPQTTLFDESLSGAHIYDNEKINEGYNLYEGKLIDMDGKVVKTWNSTYLGVIDTNGDYYAQKYYESLTWGRYTWNDSVIWEMNLPVHHEIIVTPTTIFTLTNEVHEYNGRMVEFGVILEVDKNGTILRNWSTWNKLSYLKKFHKELELEKPASVFIPEEHRKNTSIWGGNYDYYHINAMSVIPPNKMQNFHPAFTPGNWLISFRHGSMLFILDKDTQDVLWSGIYDQIPGTIEGQHAPVMLPSGTIMIFDNGRYREWSRIIELNPVTMKVEWEYKAKNFYTLSQGYIQLLSNKNMLITESEEGRVFELTPDKKIVWEFYNPDKQNATNSIIEEKFGQRQEIYRMIRYKKEFIDYFLNQNVSS